VKLLVPLALLLSLPTQGLATTYYVRQTVGDDGGDGRTPATAWKSIGKLSSAMQAGDTAYVGPGLYRDIITVRNDGAPDKRLTFIADTTGKLTGDPPGTVLITGAEPLDGSPFVPEGHPGVFKASSPAAVWGVVEMDQDQFRYWRIKSGKELPLPAGMTEIDLVAKQPSSYYYDEPTRVLYLHTSDGAHPTTHTLEYAVRGSGIELRDKHYVTIIGFTFRHVGDAAIGFYSGSSHGIAIGNTAYGSRQGIRVYGATDIAAYRNVLFRNENCGIYFAAQSTGGVVVDNVMYENIKGIRWSSDSANGTAIGNKTFDNHEMGISIERTAHVILRDNALVNNEKAQLWILDSDYSSEGNCFATGKPAELLADLQQQGLFKTLAQYQQAIHQDLTSRDGGCALPEKVDVHRLDAETRAYAERARRILSGAPDGHPEGGTDEAPPARSWWDTLFGWGGR